MFIDDVLWLLVNANVGVDGGTIFRSSKAILPSPQSWPTIDPTKGQGPYLSLDDLGGPAPTRVQNYNVPNTKKPSCSILARGLTYQATIALINAAYAAVDGQFNAFVNGTFYLSIMARTEPMDYGIDATGNNVQYLFNVDGEHG
jgi:hypothetical protein